MRRFFAFIVSMIVFGLLLYFAIPFIFQFAPHEIGLHEGHDGRLIPIFSTWSETFLNIFIELGATMILIISGLIARWIYQYLTDDL